MGNRHAERVARRAGGTTRPGEDLTDAHTGAEAEGE